MNNQKEMNNRKRTTLITDMGTLTSKIQSEIKEYVFQNGLKALVLGISGGIDSAVVAALTKPVCDELGIPLIGRSISITTNTADEEMRALLIGQSYCTDFEDVDLSIEFAFLKNSILDSEGNGNESEKEIKIREGNIKARMRMIYLYNLASLHKGMVLSTDNYTEYLLGFWTLHGDVGDYGPIQELWKTEVYNLTEYLASIQLAETAEKGLNLCITADATDGLGITSTDLDQILSEEDSKDLKSSRQGYALVDKYLMKYLNKETGVFVSKSEKMVLRRHANSRFKRLLPINIPREKLS